MYISTPIEPIDYLAVGHIAMDLVPEGTRLGGTVAYAALTAKAMGLRVGVITSGNFEDDIPALKGISIVVVPAEHSTTFTNIETKAGRQQYIHHVAAPLNISHVPESWQKTPILHLAPIAQEVDSNLARGFKDSFIGITPQGWLRTWDENGKISSSEFPEISYILRQCTSMVLSIEDVNRDESQIEEMIPCIQTMVVTEAKAGARLYWNGDIRRFTPPDVKEVDPVGAGDIFAAAYFVRLHQTQNPWEAARFATQLAANSVTRSGLDSIPDPDFILDNLSEIIQKY